MSTDEQIREVLAFMASHTQGRPLIYGEIHSTYERWLLLTKEEKVTRWERCRRRFAAAQPALALKDRVRDADEVVRHVLAASPTVH